MKFCVKCILPSTRPGIIINKDGVCNACNNSLSKVKEIDWQKREDDFDLLVQNIKAMGKDYDCLIPVSGGKDSTWQVVKCLEKGLKPLCYTWRPPSRTEIGQINLDNLIHLGVDHIDFTINPQVEKKFMLKTFKENGSVAIPMHMAIFNIAPKIALKFDIPLIVWGENSAFEYGSDDDSCQGVLMNEEWYQKFGVTHGTDASYWVDENLSEKDLSIYMKPDYKKLEEKNIRSIFLGYYYNWDPEITVKIAYEHGFKKSLKTKVGFYDFADIDDCFISIHHFLKWHKFGFSRIFDNLSLEIRNGRLSRSQAIEIIKNNGPEVPTDDIKFFCEFVNIKEQEFFEIAKKFINFDIWKKEGEKMFIEDYLIEELNFNKIFSSSN